jgi:hypothetical protein
MRTLTILITTIMGITHMASFRSIMISTIFIISVMMDTSVVTLVAVILVVILMVVTTVVFMAGEGGLNRGGFRISVYKFTPLEMTVARF